MFTHADLNPEYHYHDKHDKDDNPKKVGHPDKDELDRNESYEMVDFINHILNTWDWKGTLNIEATGKHIEKLIKTKVPSNIHSKAKIEAWMHAHWND